MWPASGVGVGVRSGAPSADITTPEALKALLLGARSVTFTAEGQSRATIDQAFDRLGIVEQMRAKTILKGPGEAPAAVARGEADVVLTLVSEMVEVPGAEAPRAVSARAAEPRHVHGGAWGRHTGAGAADRLLQALCGPPAVTARLTRHGLAPPEPQRIRR